MKPVMKSLAALPTLVTLGNAFSGFLAVTYVLEATKAVGLQPPVDGVLPADFNLYMERAVLFLLLAMVFDFMDGKVARLTGNASEFGVQVDSLCDALSFGLAPALLFKALAQHAGWLSPKAALILACAYLFGAILRLARFNVEADLEHDDHRYFKGLPSPAAAAGVSSIVYLYCTNEWPSVQPFIRIAFPWIVILLGVLMWTRLPYVHFANLVLTEKRPFSQFLLLLATIGVVAKEPTIGIPIIMVGYVLSGPVLYVWDLCTGKPTVEGESLL